LIKKTLLILFKSNDLSYYIDIKIRKVDVMRKFKILLIVLCIVLIFMSLCTIANAASIQNEVQNNLLEYAGIPAVVIIIGISEAIKRLGFKKKFIPIINVILGILTGILITNDLVRGIILGSVVGLGASGLYSSGKNVYQGIKK